MARPQKPSEDYASDEPKEELIENARESGVENAEEAVEEYQEDEAHYGGNDRPSGPDRKKSDEEKPA